MDAKIQRQDSLKSQLNDLIDLGNSSGLYDAVDFIRRATGYEPDKPGVEPCHEGSHHLACECREAQFRALVEAAEKTLVSGTNFETRNELDQALAPFRAEKEKR